MSLTNLVSLELSNSNISGDIDFSVITELKELSVDFTNVNIIQCGLNKSNLEELVVDDEQSINNRAYLQQLASCGVKVLNPNYNLVDLGV